MTVSESMSLCMKHDKKVWVERDGKGIFVVVLNGKKSKTSHNSNKLANEAAAKTYIWLAAKITSENGNV